MALKHVNAIVVGAGAGGGGGSWTPPEGLPADFAGATAEETVTKLFGGFQELNTRAEGLRTKLAGMPKIPDNADGYSFEPSDKTKPYFGDLAGNPLFDLARESAHAAGLPAEGFSKFLENFYGQGAEKGIITAPYDPASEVDSYIKTTGVDRSQATARLEANLTFANGLAEQMIAQINAPDEVKAGVKAQMVALTDTAAGNMLIDQLQARFNDLGFKVGGESTVQGALSKEDLRKLDSDPRIDPKNRENPDPAKRFDPELRKRYDAAYDQHYGRQAV